MPRGKKKGGGNTGRCVRDQVVPILCLFQTAECHLRAGDVFLGILEVFELYNEQESATTAFCQAGVCPD